MTGRKVCGVDAFGSVFTYGRQLKAWGRNPSTSPWKLWIGSGPSTARLKWPRFWRESRAIRLWKPLFVFAWGIPQRKRHLAPDGQSKTWSCGGGWQRGAKNNFYPFFCRKKTFLNPARRPFAAKIENRRL